MSSVYLDHAATTPISTAALAAMNTQAQVLGNPSSLHAAGRSTRKALEDARERIAAKIGALPSEIIFTASGTEANNTALKGFYWLGRKSGRNVILISAIEHRAISDPARWLKEHEGAEVIELPVSADGVVDLAVLKKMVDSRGDEIAIISLMHSNNETGVIQPISEVVKIAGNIPVHCDAVQSFCKVPLSFSELGLTALTISAHKIGGPLGVGALVLRRTLEIPPLLHGGGQERDIRSGTLNAPAIVGFATAVDYEKYPATRILSLRDYFIHRVIALIPDAAINGEKSERLPGIVNITFPGTQSEILLLLMDGASVSCSTGSACSAGVHEASHVLLAMGHTEKTALSSLRFSLGATTTAAEIDYVLSVLPGVIARGRAANSI